MRDKELKILVEEWIRKADDDELSIKAILTEKGAPSTACFLSQQMAEKYLKAFIASRGKDLPKIHQLERLLGICKKLDKFFRQLDNEAVLLSEYYVETRYPGDYPEGFSWKDANGAFRAAVKIKEFVLKKL
ncbi:HEPN domain-containing protein [Patescibacteria group bacterium]|nr:HEPN domain-containing protein [Patescibacteria group bacterium]